MDTIRLSSAFPVSTKEVDFKERNKSPVDSSAAITTVLSGSVLTVAARLTMVELIRISRSARDVDGWQHTCGKKEKVNKRHATTLPSSFAPRPSRRAQ